MKVVLDVPLEYDIILKDGFLLMIRVATSFKDKFTQTNDVREDYDEDEHFVGQTQDRLTESFHITWNLYCHSMQNPSIPL